ncbi:MAG: tetratricopeptide repeat protein [Candidatus Muirbacterium halophilum]|nr:tetratricopeptide repeat protein [Candidatus Muirbacterium halophilum]MCK9475151.1 tetratricopeptide repeat protein [Candidatus Muirbacterium halophilum]
MSNKLFPDVWNNKGLDFFQKKEYSNAIKCFKRAIALNRKYIEAYVNLGNTYSVAGLNEQAVKAYTKASVLDPLYIEKYGIDISKKKKEDHEAYIFEARRAFLNSDNIRALEFTNEAIRLKPEYPDYRNLNAEINMRIGKFEQARFNLEKALELNPAYEKAKKNLAEILYLRGIFFFRDGMKEEGLSIWKKALSIYPRTEFIRIVVNMDFTKNYFEVKCSNCNEFIKADYNYCPNCGMQR